MGRIEQVFWTHCTPNTSFHGDDGYAVRATSISRADWDGSLKPLLDPLLMGNKYEPPTDVPEHARRAHADRMPVRFSYIPAERNWSVLVHDCYRAEDSTQYRRLGSQFAHCLVTRQSPSWPTVDCLRLWRAPGWVRVDPSDPNPVLRSAASFAEWTDGAEPVIGEELLYRFLTVPSDGDFADPHFVISRHCRRASAGTRTAILHDLLQGFLGLDHRAKAWLLLVADPDLAALLFFGILRLLPQSLFESPVSFSTYESSLARQGLTLVATTHYDPLKTRLNPAEATAGGCGFIMDLFGARRNKLPATDAAYAAYTLRLLRDQGWHAVDQWLRRCEAMEAKTVKDLEELTRDHAVARRLFRPGVEVPIITSGSRLERYAKLLVQDRLARPVTTPSGASTFGDPASIAHAPGCPLALRLLFADGDVVSSQSAAARLLPHLPASTLEDVVSDKSFPDVVRSDALRTYVDREGRLPSAWLSHVAAENETAPHSAQRRLLLGLIKAAAPDRLAKILASTSNAIRFFVLREIASCAPHSRFCHEFLWDRLRKDLTLSLAALGSGSLYEPMSKIVAAELNAKALTKEQIRQLATGENIRTVAALMLGLNNTSYVRLASDLLKETSGSDIVTLVRMPELPAVSRANLLLASNSLAGDELNRLIEEFYHAIVSRQDPRKLHMVAMAFVTGLEWKRVRALAMGSPAEDSERQRVWWLELLLCAIEHHVGRKAEVPAHLKTGLGELLQTLPLDLQLHFAAEKYGQRIIPYLPQVPVESQGADEAVSGRAASPTAPIREGLVNRLVRWQAKRLVEGAIEEEWAKTAARLNVLRSSPHLVPPASTLAQHWHDFLVGLAEFSPGGPQAKQPGIDAIKQAARSFALAIQDSCSPLNRRDLALRYLRAAEAPSRVIDGFVLLLAEGPALEAAIRHLDVKPFFDDTLTSTISHSKDQSTKHFKLLFPLNVLRSVQITVHFTSQQTRPKLARDRTHKQFELTAKKGIVTTVITLANIGIKTSKLDDYDLEVYVEFASEFWEGRTYRSNRRQLRAADFTNFGQLSSFKLQFDDSEGWPQDEPQFLKGLLNRWDREPVGTGEKIDDAIFPPRWS